MVYSEIIDVVTACGIQNNVVNESVGTGDGTTKTFTLDYGPVIGGTDKIYVDSVLKTRTTDYTINEEWKTITFTTAPADTKAIKADYKYYPTGYVDSDIDRFIEASDAMIDLKTGKKFSNSNSVTEYFSGRPEKISSTTNVKEGQYYEVTTEQKRLISLSNFPVQAITSLQFLDDDGTVDDTLTENTDFHLWTDTGWIWIFNTTIPKGMNRKKVKVVYTYGYSSVPTHVKRLSAITAGMMWLANMMGGSFDDVTSYQLPEISATKGEPYMNMRASFEKLEKEAKELWRYIGIRIPFAAV